MAVLSMSKQEFSRLDLLLRVQSGRLRFPNTRHRNKRPRRMSQKIRSHCVRDTDRRVDPGYRAPQPAEGGFTANRMAPQWRP
jgi:hypothetical protein